MRAIVLSLAVASIGAMSHAETLTLTPTSVTEWKSVFGQIETKDRVPARARIAGTVDTLDVSEGDKVTAGQLCATITDTTINVAAVQPDRSDRNATPFRKGLSPVRAEAPVVWPDIPAS